VLFVDGQVDVYVGVTTRSRSPDPESIVPSISSVNGSLSVSIVKVSY